MIIDILVKPGKRESKIEVSDSGQLIAWLKKRPVDNEANDELTELLAKYYMVSKSNINIKSGFRSKNKLIEIIK